MRIAIDSRPLGDGNAFRGVGTYTSELIESIRKTISRDFVIEPIDFTKNGLYDYDLLHFTYFDPFRVSLPLQKNSKWVITVHDVIPLIYPDVYVPGVRGALNLLLNKYLIKQSDRVITISETSKKDIIRFLGISPDKVDVTYEAPKKLYKEIKNQKLMVEVKNKYNLPEKFVLYVGDINYNKNLITLVRACEAIQAILVVCGKQAKQLQISATTHPELKHLPELEKAFKENNVLTLGYVEDEEMSVIYNLASVYCQPSLYEGFGLPILEAMSCGTPVVISKTQALVEIAGDSAQISEVKDSRDFANKIASLLKSPSETLYWKRKGLARVKQFSWEKTAEETLNTYRKVFKTP